MHPPSLIFFILFSSFLLSFFSYPLQIPVQLSKQETTQAIKKPKILYGTASFYADKFTGRKTATGAIYSHNKMTAACNVLPLGTWIRVTNLRNERSVIAFVNDRLHPKNKRIVDMSKMGAERLGYVSRGLTQVKVEVLEKVIKTGGKSQDK